MTREVKISLPFAQGTAFKLYFCNKYAVPFHNTTRELVLGASGEVIVDLEVNAEDTCWKVDLLTHDNIFWVHEAEGVQNVDMTMRQYPQRSLLTLSGDKDSLPNVVNAIDMSMCYGVLTQEEQRLMCRYDKYYEDGQDMLICDIDAKVGVTYV